MTKILDDSGDVLVNYTYDAWGKVLSTKNGNGQNITDQSSIAFLNPFRYRGYVYDTETQLYYLQSRYYDPITGRFINADTYTDTQSGTPLSTNMFAYCENNPINSIDETGEWFHTIRGYRKHIFKHERKYILYHKYTRNYIKFKGIYQGKVNFANAVQRRYKNNKKIFGNYTSYIFGQNNSLVANMMMGDYYIKNNGCGLIAIYNVLVEKNKFISLPNIIKEAELNNMLWLYGCWGTHENGVDSFLKNHGILYTNYSRGYGFKYINEINNYNISILYVLNKDGWTRHYFCVLKN